MAERSTRHAAVRWILLFLLVAPTLGQIVEERQKLSTERSPAADIITEYPKATRLIPETSLGDTNITDTQRSERMVAVYVKPDPTAKTKNISDFLDYGDILVKSEDEKTIVITDPAEDDYEEDDEDIMKMAARSLKQNFTIEDQLAAEAESFRSTKQPSLEDNDLKLKEILYKLNRELHLKDLYKINLATVFAKDYEEMNKLMNENLVEDTDVFARSKGMASEFEPRDSDMEKLDLDMAAEATEEVANHQVLPPASTTSRPVFRPQDMVVRPSSQRFAYAYHGRVPPTLQPFQGELMYQPHQRSDTTPSYLLLPRPGSSSRQPEVRPVSFKTGNGQSMNFFRDGPAMRLPVTATALRQPAMVPPERTPTIRRPQISSKPPSSPAGRFGERLVSRLPLPVQKIFNRTVGGRQTTTQAPTKTFLSSSALHLPASSTSHPTRIRAPYYLRPSTQNVVPPPSNTRNRPINATVSTTTKPRVTTEPPNIGGFGARVRPFRFERQRNATNATQNVKKETTEQRDMKISQLRSNLVGKLVVIQTVLDKKKSKAGSRPPAVPFNRNGLPNGFLKPIVPLRLWNNVQTTTAASSITTNDGTGTQDVEVATTESTVVWKDKKKYRRPPSFKKGNYNILPQNAESGDPATQRESVVVFENEKVTTLPILNATEPSTPFLDQQTAASPYGFVSEVEGIIAPTSFTDTTARFTTKMKDSEVATTPAFDVAGPSVNISLTMTTEATATLLTETENGQKVITTPTIEGARLSAEISSPWPMASTTEMATKKMFDEVTLPTPLPVVAPQTEKTSVEANTRETSTEEQIDRQESTIVSKTAAIKGFVETSPLPVENVTDAPTSSGILTSTSKLIVASQFADILPTKNSLSSVESTENNTTSPTSTYAPENDPYLQEMIERALRLPVSDEDDEDDEDDEEAQENILKEANAPEEVSSTNPWHLQEDREDTQGNLPQKVDAPGKVLNASQTGLQEDQEDNQRNSLKEDEALRNLEEVRSSNLRDLLEDREKTQRNFPKRDDAPEEVVSANLGNLQDDETDPVDTNTEEISFTDSILSRLGRSAEKSLRMDSKTVLNKSRNQEVLYPMNLARGGNRLFDLPYNILPDDTFSEGQPKEDESKDTRSERQPEGDKSKDARNQVQPKESQSQLTVPMGLHQASHDQRHPSLAGLLNKLYSLFIA